MRYASVINGHLPHTGLEGSHTAAAQWLSFTRLSFTKTLGDWEINNIAAAVSPAFCYNFVSDIAPDENLLSRHKQSGRGSFGEPQALTDTMIVLGDSSTIVRLVVLLFFHYC
jgi:hypothetical protein